MNDATVVHLVQNYQQLVKEHPANFDDVKDRGVFVIMWRRSRAKSQVELAAYFQSIENRSKQPAKLGFHIVPQKDRNACVAIIGGIGTYEWLLNLLNTDDGNSIDVAAPWPKPWNLKKDGLPTRENFDALRNRR